jgi:hypothetical protein
MIRANKSFGTHDHEMVVVCHCLMFVLLASSGAKSGAYEFEDCPAERRCDWRRYL